MSRVRRANSVEAPALVAILMERYPETRYAGKVGIDEPLARKMFAQAIHRHGGTNEGATFVMVSENGAGEIEAFFMGALNRVYMVGDMLAATDCFLLARKGCGLSAMHDLLDAYLEWAMANPKVYEIGLSWADTIPGNEWVIANYSRRDFIECGKTFRRENSAQDERRAA